MTTPPVESTFVRLLDAVRVNAIGVQDGTVRLELFPAVQEFLQRSDIWHAEVELTTQLNVFFYQMPFYLDGGQINRLIWLEGLRPPSGVSNQVFNHGPPRFGYLEKTGSTAVLRIDGLSSASELWRAHVALSCVDPTDTNGLPILPSWIVDKYWDYLLSGVLSRLCGQPNKPYTNDKLVLFHGRKFMDGINLAKKESREGFQLGGQRWRYPQTFRSKSQRMWP